MFRRARKARERRFGSAQIEDEDRGGEAAVMILLFLPSARYPWARRGVNGRRGASRDGLYLQGGKRAQPRESPVGSGPHRAKGSGGSAVPRKRCPRRKTASDRSRIPLSSA